MPCADYANSAPFGACWPQISHDLSCTQELFVVALCLLQFAFIRFFRPFNTRWEDALFMLIGLAVRSPTPLP